VFLGRTPGKLLSRVIVELLLVKEGTSIEIRTTSGPGSPMRRDWKSLCSALDEGAMERRCESSTNDEGAVETRRPSKDMGERGEAIDEPWLIENVLRGVNNGAGSLIELTSDNPESLLVRIRRGDGAGESLDS